MKQKDTLENKQVTAHRMNHKVLVLAVGLFSLVVIGMFTFAILQKKEQIQEQTTDQTDRLEHTAVDESPYSSITRVDAVHYYHNGVHTFVGEIDMPTPCDLLEADVRTKDNQLNQFTISFTVINNSSTCAQVVTPARFKVEVSADESAHFDAQFMGRPIELNSIPADPGDTPETFELFMKG